MGTLRGGNTGILTEDGKVLGKCHRVTMLRYLGIGEPKDVDSQSYFNVGFENEDTWVERLKLAWPGVVRCEEEIPVSWTVPNTDKLVTGRPDAVLGHLDGETFVPVQGIEFKALAAASSAIGIRYEDTPKDAHLMQAAHYSWQLGVPFTLVYTFNGKATLPYWAKKLTQDKEILPFKREYPLGWDNGQLYYINSQGQRIDTIITQQAIIDYYSLVVDMAENKKLYDRPSQMNVHGGRGWDPCNYCAFKPVCDTYETTTFDRWLDEAKLKSKETE